MSEVVRRVKGHRTMAAVMLATAVILVLVCLGDMPVDRAVVALGICWALAFNSETIIEHKQETVRALELAAKAGVEFRAGQLEACANELSQAGELVAGELQEFEAEKQGEAHA